MRTHYFEGCPNAKKDLAPPLIGVRLANGPSMSAEEYDTLEPWRRQPCDTPQSFAAFQEFLFLTLPRRLSRLSARWDRERVEGWATRHAWQARAEAYDDHLAAVRLAAVERVEEAMATRHAALGRKAQRIAQRELDKLERLSEEDPPALREGSVLRYLESGVRVEREAAGMPAPVAAPELDLSKLSLDEIRLLRDLTAKAGG